MPLLTLTTPQALGEEQRQRLADALAAALTEILQVPTRLLWMHFIHSDYVQEGLLDESAAPHTVVTVVASPRPDAVVSEALQRIAGVLLPALDLTPDQLWRH